MAARATAGSTMQDTVGVLPTVILPPARNTASRGLAPNSGSSSGDDPIKHLGQVMSPTRGPGREARAVGGRVRAMSAAVRTRAMRSSAAAIKAASDKGAASAASIVVSRSIGRQTVAGRSRGGHRRIGRAAEDALAVVVGVLAVVAV